MRNTGLVLSLLSTAAVALAQQYTITTTAGKGNFSGDGGPATAALLNNPQDVAVDPSGNVYLTDTGNNRIRKVDKSGTIQTIAGTGRTGFSGDGGPAVAADVNGPGAIVIESDGTIYFADEYFFSSATGFSRVRRIAPNGIITTIAGKAGTGDPAADSSGLCKPGGDGGAALAATLCYTTALARDSQGNFYSADYTTIREFTAGGNISTIAGTGKYGYTGDGGPAAQATFGSIYALATDNNGNLYVADAGNRAIRKIDAHRTINTVAVIPASLNWVSVDQNGDLFYSAGTGVYKLVNGSPSSVATLTDSGAASALGFAFDSGGNLYVADGGSSTIDKFSGGSSTIIAGTVRHGFSNAGPALDAQLQFLEPSLTVDGAGNVYFKEVVLDLSSVSTQARIVKVTPAGTLVPLLGPNVQLPTGDPAKPTLPLTPNQLAVDPSGSAIYFGNGFLSTQIFKLTPGGNVTRYAGRRGAQQDDGDGGLALNAGIASGVTGMVVDRQGNLFISEELGAVVRKIDTSGKITTYAGVGKQGYSGDGGRAIDAKLSRPLGLAVDSGGTLYIADYLSYRVRKVNPQGVITTIAGSGKFGFSGDGGPATSAAMVGPIGVAVDPTGNVFFSDTATSLIPGPIVVVPYPANNRIRMVDKTGIITTVAGSGTGGADTGDGGPATSAELSEPAVMGADAAGNIYFNDFNNAKIRKLTPSTIALGSAASYAFGAQAVESIVSAFGLDLANQTASATGTPGTTLGGTSVTIHDSAGVDHAAPLFFVAPSQVNFEIPSGTAAGAGGITVRSGAGVTSTAPLVVANISPGIFALNGAGLAAANVLYVHADKSQTYDSIYSVKNGAVVAKQVNLGSVPGGKAYLLIYGTGIRAAQTANVSVTIGGVNAKVLYAGAQGVFLGEDQVNVEIPGSLAGAGDVPIVLTAGGKVANIVRVTIH